MELRTPFGYLNTLIDGIKREKPRLENTVKRGQKCNNKRRMFLPALPESFGLVQSSLHRLDSNQQPIG